MRIASLAWLLCMLPLFASAKGVEWNFDVARQCAELAEYIDDLGTLAGVQQYERVERTSDLAKLRQEYNLTYNTARIVLGPQAMSVLGDSTAGIRSLERSVLACVNLGECEPTAVGKSAQDLGELLVAACQTDFRGSE